MLVSYYYISGSLIPNSLSLVGLLKIRTCISELIACAAYYKYTLYYSTGKNNIVICRYRSAFIKPVSVPTAVKMPTVRCRINIRGHKMGDTRHKSKHRQAS